MSHVLDSISFGAIVTVRDRLLAQQAAGRRIYRLESGDPSFDTPPYVRDAIVAALEKGHTHYTASAGIQPLREAIVRKVQRDNELPIHDPDQVVVTSGGMHALYLTFRALLDPGDEVILPDPMWTEIAENIRLGGGVPVRCRMDLESPTPWTAAQIEQLITPRTKAIFVNTPHNPTGVVLSRAVLRDIVALAKKHDLRIISDEAYEHVIFDGEQHVSIGSLPGAEDRTISLYSCSKSYAMSGLRVGYLVSTDTAFLSRVKKLLRCTTNGVNSLAQWGAAAAIGAPQDTPRLMGAVYQERRDALLAGLEGIDLLVPYVPKGSFFLWARIQPSWRGYRGSRGDEAMTDWLIDEVGVGSSPGSAFGPAGAGWIRFAFSCDTKEVQAAAGLVHQVLAGGGRTNTRSAGADLRP
ncbi:MAG: pyridoxal phosphate-dependent aminotransferase [Myxococcota bacterium]